MKKILSIIGISLVALLTLGLGVTGLYFYLDRYDVSPEMNIEIKEYDQFEYPQDPAHHSSQYGRYNNRKLKLIQKDPLHFDFVFLPDNCNSIKSCKSNKAIIVFRDINVSNFFPRIPSWIRGNANLETIAITDREWNRQQVKFKPDHKNIEIIGGNGYEKDHIDSIEISKNCLNAGLWEILLFTKENNKKSLYYHGWFDFPIGFYKNIYESINNRNYWAVHHRLEHWVDPEGIKLDLSKLRKIKERKKVIFDEHLASPVFLAGEQINKTRTTNQKNICLWKDYTDEDKYSDLTFATFAPPGKYFTNKPWKNEYWRLAKISGAVYASIQSPAPQFQNKNLNEIILFFEDSRTKGINRFIISGFEAQKLPQLPIEEYYKGLYMPMGIATPPFSQNYNDLINNPPHESPYFNLFVDSDNRWLNHHDIAIDGVAMHRDIENPSIIHIHILSYERHTIIRHISIQI